MDNVMQVATALTACGIETRLLHHMVKNLIVVATALTACGIETSRNLSYVVKAYVATALTACGIETSIYSL